MANVNVTLDVTGFFFSKQVNVDENSTIKEVMIRVVEESAGTDAEFTFSPHITAAGEFCRMISIHFKEKPKTRQFSQDGNPFEPPNLRMGVYEFDDYAQSNQEANPQLAWQYYVVGQDGKGELRSGEVDGRRTVVPFSKSNMGVGAVPKLKEGDRIFWRLVGICVGPTRSAPASVEMLALDDAKKKMSMALPFKYQPSMFKAQ